VWNNVGKQESPGRDRHGIYALHQKITESRGAVFWFYSEVSANHKNRLHAPTLISVIEKEGAMSREAAEAYPKRYAEARALPT
jgi:hypothetical protein